MPTPFDGIAGTMPRTTFVAQYHRITPAQHRQAVRRALHRATWMAEDDVLMEAVEGQPDLVQVYPADVAPYPWRTLWRKTANTGDTQT